MKPCMLHSHSNWLFTRRAVYSYIFTIKLTSSKKFHIYTSKVEAVCMLITLCIHLQIQIIHVRKFILSIPVAHLISAVTKDLNVKLPYETWVKFICKMASPWDTRTQWGKRWLVWIVTPRMCEVRWRLSPAHEELLWIQCFPHLFHLKYWCLEDEIRVSSSSWDEIFQVFWVILLCSVFIFPTIKKNTKFLFVILCFIIY